MAPRIVILPSQTRSPALRVAVIALAAALSACQSVETEYYDAGGTTVEQAFRSVGRHGPDRGRAIGQTEVAMSMDFWTLESDTDCRIVKAEVNLELKVILPRWTELDKTDAANRANLKNLAKYVKDHEHTHVQIAKRFQRQIQRDVNRIPPAKTCKIVENEARKVFRQGMRVHDSAQIQFDANTS
ncbi:DUF922 domain-containing Zn-dependent protease [Hoeflea sp. WL0058]|uniref:DUF922 domain-containing Zn-dependent protease n=1 Tax=Flavimaribacter sediminis TaxID=2865987 RepID=A0AAE3D368_9HYPH|nr:DUF922 domain-containing protein [Flavimaribacter sediminis]MBW8639516.1 DUF922 domain-containing Zn-dependent protease [Flavimaribacter sediminis]